MDSSKLSFGCRVNIVCTKSVKNTTNKKNSLRFGSVVNTDCTKLLVQSQWIQAMYQRNISTNTNEHTGTNPAFQYEYFEFTQWADFLSIVLHNSSETPKINVFVQTVK